jgi:predicted amidohydrolase YtcJ
MIDSILHNATIITQDPQQPTAEALAIANGTIVASGSSDEMLALASSATRVVDLQRSTVIPGLVDAHVHWQMYSESLLQVDLFEVPSREEAVERVAAAAAVAGPGEWILGRGWIQDVWPDRGFPNAAHLDALVPAHPVFLGAKSGHAAWVNSAALRRAGVNRRTPDPPGGVIQRDAAGEPTGLLLETAIELVLSVIPARSVERLSDAMEAAQARVWRMGLTGLHDFDNPSALVAMQVLRERGHLGLRFVKNINQGWIEHAIASGLRWGFGDAWIRMGGLKLFADGALGPRTAAMIDPYEGEPDNRGIMVLDQETMTELVSRASLAGLPATIHAIGDRAVHEVLNVYETVRGLEREHRIPREQRRHRIEHVQVIHPDDRGRLAELGIIASMQPIHATGDWELVERYWGKRGRWAYHFRLQAEQGVPLAFGSDAPVESIDPIAGIHAAVTRRRADGSPGPDGFYPDARMSVAQALAAYTIGPAYAAGLEHTLGRLMPGYLADLVVLDRDPHQEAPDALLDTQVLATMVGGEWRYSTL